MIAFASATLAQFTSPQLLVPCLQGDHRESVIAELSQCLAGAGWLEDAAMFTRSVLEHEAQAPAVFDGVAFPLAHPGALCRLAFAVGLARQPFPWGGPRSPRVRAVVLLAVPVAETSRQLPLILAFCKFLGDSTAFASLRASRTPAEMLAVLDRIRFQP